MKKTILFLFSLMLITYVSAQGSLGKGGKQLNAGLGFSNWGLPVYVGADFGVHPDITVGGEVSFRLNTNTIGIAANGNYHFNKLLELPSEFDLYAGINLGFYTGSNNPWGFNAQVGGRYFFQKNLAVNLEVGGGWPSGGRFGVTYIF